MSILNFSILFNRQLLLSLYDTKLLDVKRSYVFLPPRCAFIVDPIDLPQRKKEEKEKFGITVYKVQERRRGLMKLSRLRKVS